MTRTIGTLMLVCLAGCAVAEAGTPVFNGSVGGTSDFVFRGLSLTRGAAAAQASFDFEFPREYYVGGFVAGVDPNPGPSPAVEFDVWAGRYWRVDDDVSLDLRLSQYTYPDDPRRVSYNRSEVTGTLGFRDRWFVAAIYSPNTKAVGTSPGYEEGDAWAVEVSRRHAFNQRLSLAAGLGLYGLRDIYHDNFAYWNVTLIANLAPFELQFAWLGIDSSAEDHFRADSTGNRVAITALWRFPATR